MKCGSDLLKRLTYLSKRFASENIKCVIGYWQRPAGIELVRFKLKCWVSRATKKSVSNSGLVLEPMSGKFSETNTFISLKRGQTFYPTSSTPGKVSITEDAFLTEKEMRLSGHICSRLPVFS